jgi:hypothetical protein
MKIGLIGYGSMSSVLGRRWAEQGHSLFVGGRDTAKARSLADSLGGGHGSMADAVAFGEIVFIGLRHEAVFDAIEHIGPSAFSGKVVIDPNNPVSIQDFSRTMPYQPSLAEAIQAKLPGAHVVKAFNMCQAKVWEQPARADQPLTVFICGDDAGAKSTVTGLIDPLGYRALDVGGLQRAIWLEASANLVIYLLFNGHDLRTVLNLNVLKP